MVLKRLILQGFKSFPDKTEIQFLGGVTAIVGPNGSGKSNISDAIRWTLGEQSSRSLRGTKMEDVIFSGTAKRHPVGFAEVSLILDNTAKTFRSEFTELMVTRRFYRSGESEYFLNKKRCRLRDVHELFMDTGLGRDGYSMIGQGRIDEILSLKSENRRDIFEEAAGISKFRWRKEEAERKLAATEENVTRIQDLYDELEQRLAPLQQQAEKARQYLRLRDELRVLEVSLWLADLERIRTDRAKRSADRDICARQLTEAKQAQQALYARVDQLTADMREIDRQADRLRTTLRETEQRIAEQTERAAVLRANRENAERNIARTRKQSAQRAEQIQRLDTQAAERRARLRALQQQQQALQEQSKTLEQQTQAQAQQRSQAEQAWHEAEAAQHEQQQALHTLELERTAAETGLTGINRRWDTIEQEAETAQRRLTEEQQAHRALEAQQAACRETLAATQATLQQATQQAETAQKQTESLRETTQQAQAALTNAKNRVKLLSDMQRDYEGFSRSVKAIMGQAAKQKLHGVHGPVSSLLQVESLFVTAIDTALGTSASSIVVDTAEDGKACIDYLKRSDSGRATFLPLDTIRPARLDESSLTYLAQQAGCLTPQPSQSGCYGTADTLVSCEERYRAIIQNLLARTVVCRDMETALPLAKACHNRFRIVTLDGQIIQAGGAMTGGSVSHGTGVLARAASLQEAQEQQQALSVQQEQAKQAYQAALAESAACEQKRKAVEAKRAQAEQQAAGLQAAATQHQTFVVSLQQQYDGLQLEQQSLAAARKQHQSTIAACQKQQIQTQAALQQTIRLVADKRAALEQCDATTAHLTEQLAALQTTSAEIRSESASETRTLFELQTLRQEADAGLAEANQAIAGFEADIAQFHAELEQLAQDKQDSSQATEKLQRQITAQLAQRERVEGERSKTERAAQDKNEERSTLERETAQLEQRISQLDDEETHILDSMWESYELTPTPAAAFAQPVPNRAEAKNKAQSLRMKMKALGNVNLDAEAEYLATKERYTFLSQQKRDLEQARQELVQVMEQLTENMKEQFATSFATLNEYFGATFQEIFGGGQAELLLEDTSDILNCGIEIRVTPPGKAVKALSLLSGGERAFVAIALYFAILKLRPTPFCILDEIEAALDDVNVARFADYIRRLTERTQFIVITHRRGTMEAADMLYGVTMQEQGVSKLLMLNLAEAEKRLGKIIE